MNAIQSPGLACGALTAALLGQALWPALAVAEPTEGAWNFERVGIATLPDGQLDLASFSKLAPWPNTDGDYLYSGCYDPSPLDAAMPAPDRCFMTVDLSDPTNPVRLATVPNFDPVASPAPPSGHAVWSPDYPFPNLPASVPCRVDWNAPEIASATQAPPCWDPGWNSHNHYVSIGIENGPTIGFQN